jgi:hypothetical protein
MGKKRSIMWHRKGPAPWRIFGPRRRDFERQEQDCGPRELPRGPEHFAARGKIRAPEEAASGTTEVTPPEFEHCHLQSSIARALSQATRPLPVSWEGISGRMTDSSTNNHAGYQGDWPIRTYEGQHPPARSVPGRSGREAEIVNCMLASGTVIVGGTLRHSILFPS